MSSGPPPEQAPPKVQASPPPLGPAILGRWRVPFFYGWVIVAVCYVADFMASGLGGSTITLFFKPMGDSLGWSLSQLVGATTAATLGGICVAPFIGRVIDRLGVKPVMLWGSVVAGVGMLLMMFITQVWQFWVLYASIAALGLAEFAGLASNSAVSKWFARKRGRALSYSTLGQTNGNLVMAPIVAITIAWLGWRHAWGAMGLVLLSVMVPMVIILVRNRPEDVGLLPDGDVQPTGKDGASAMQITEATWTVSEAVRTKSLWVLLLVFLFGGATNGVMTNLAPFLVNVHGMSNTNVGWVLSGYWIPGTGARLIWGYLVEKLPLRFCLFCVCVGRALGPISLALVAYPWNIGTYYFFSGLIGNAFGILQPVMFGNYFGRKSFASIQGGMRPFLAIPQLTMPLLLSVLYEAQGSFTLGFLVSGGLTFLGAVAALFAVPPVKRSVASAASPSQASAGKR